MKSKRKTAPTTAPRAQARTTPPPPAKVAAARLPFKDARDLMTECAKLYAALKGGLDDQRARTAGYLLQVAGSILRTCDLEKRVREIEKTLARHDADREQTHGAD